MAKVILLHYTSKIQQFKTFKVCLGIQLTELQVQDLRGEVQLMAEARLQTSFAGHSTQVSVRSRQKMNQNEKGCAEKLRTEEYLKPLTVPYHFMQTAKIDYIDHLVHLIKFSEKNPN